MATRLSPRAPILRIFRIAAPVCIALPLLAATAADAQTYTLTTLATFDGADGTHPDSGVTLDSSGNLYGTTYEGGADNDGTVFEVAAGTNTLTTLDTFSGANGANCFPGLTLAPNGTLYGATSDGGTNNDGTVFEITGGGGTFTTLANFTGTANGSLPDSDLTLDSSGNLYGTTFTGGADNYGTVFEIAAGTSTLTTLASFTDASGADPGASVTLDSNGDTFGTLYLGGANDDGIVYEIAAGTNTVTTLATFNGANGANPYAGLTLDSSGNLFGTTLYGGTSGDGTVFEIAAGTNTITTLASFTGANGDTPEGNLALDAKGDLFGTTTQGGASNLGTVFEVAAGSNSIATLTSFNGANGSVTSPNLTIDSNGDLFGTTASGGANDDGTVFELTPSVSGAAAAPEPGALALLLPLTVPAAFGLVRRRRKTHSPLLSRGARIQECTSTAKMPERATNLGIFQFAWKDR